MSEAYLSLGSNVGNREANLRGALDELDASPGVQLLRVSPLYETEPVGVTDQPRFLNLCARIETELQPEALLSLAKEIERRLERRTERRWGPRSIDIDILLYGEAGVTREDLVVPHPEMERRAFVLIPLAAIAPHIKLPSGRTPGEALAALGAHEAVKPYGDPPNTRAKKKEPPQAGA